MPFTNSGKDKVLVKSRWCFCVCQELTSLYTNVYHIVQVSGGGSNKLENAILSCLILFFHNL
jgi:hypothetical protein